MASACPFCGEKMKWMEKDVYGCATHGQFRMETITITEWKWLEVE